MNPSSPPAIFRRSEAVLGESLVAHTIDGREAMMWCDITAGLIHHSPWDGKSDGSNDSTIALTAPVCSFHPAVVDGRHGLVVSLADRVVIADFASTIVKELSVVEHAHSGMRLNEGKVDPRGRWVTGSMNQSGSAADGAFYLVSEDEKARVLRQGIAIANGIDWSEDGSRVYFTDTGSETIYTGRYGPAGEITEVDVFVNDGAHDGLTIDRDGNVWTAIHGRGRVSKYSPSGEKILDIDVPAPNVTSVAFGGVDRSTLFIASARENLSEAQLSAHPLSGSVFAVTTDTSGRPPNIFGCHS